MKALLLLLACTALLVGRASAAEPQAFRLADRVVERVLPNGLKVLLLPNPKAPVVSFQVWYRVGSRNEVLGRTGISHLLEHMMFKGTERVGPEQFARIIQEHGGNNNAFTSADFTAYFENMAAKEIGTALELEADRLVNLKLRQEDFTTERMVVVEERRLRTEDDPQARLSEELDAAAYMAHPYGWPTVGWLNDIEKLTVDDVRRYHELYYHPGNAFLVVVGDFDPQAMLAQVEKNFAAIPRGPEPPAMRAVEPPQLGEREVRLEVPARLPTLSWGYHVPNLAASAKEGHAEEGYALEVLQAVLSSGDSSRLERKLVRSGLAVEAGADYSLLSIDPSLFYLDAQVMPGKEPAEVAKALEREVKRLQEEPLSQTELAKAKNQLEASFVRGQDSLFFQGMLLALNEMSVGWRRVDDYLPGVRRVSAADVQAVARKYLRPENRTAARLVPTAPKGGAMPPAGPSAGKVVR